MLDFEEIRAAAARIEGSVVRTPLQHSRTLSALTGAEVFLKYENLQFTASFKERGALNKLLSLSASERARGVIAMSAGNHAQGVAYHAARLGVRAVIVMPRFTPNTKMRGTEVLGAEVRLEGNSLAEAASYARTLAETEKLVFVHPYDDAAVIAGQGSVALEILEDRPDIECLVVPVGGGGLIAGMATVAKALNPDIEIIGVEPKGYASMYQQLNGLPVSVGGDTIAEGLAVRDIGELALKIARQLVREVLLVEEDAIEQAIVALVELEKTVVEGAGAAGLAALMMHKHKFAGRRVAIPLCGGNIDTRVLSAVLMRGLMRDGRLVQLHVAVPDVAGSLARVTALIGEAGGNIIEVHHQRVFGIASVKTPEVEFIVETRDSAHTAMLVAKLEAAGIRTRLLA